MIKGSCIYLVERNGCRVSLATVLHDGPCSKKFPRLSLTCIAQLVPGVPTGCGHPRAIDWVSRPPCRKYHENKQEPELRLLRFSSVHFAKFIKKVPYLLLPSRECYRICLPNYRHAPKEARAGCANHLYSISATE